MGLLGSSTQYVEKTTSNGRCLVRVHVLKLPAALTKVLEESGELLGDMIEGKSSRRRGSVESHVTLDDSDSVAALKKRIIDSVGSELEAAAQSDEEKIEKYKSLFLQFLQRIWSLGPRQVGPNFLIVPDCKASDVIYSSSGRRGILIGGSCQVSKRLRFLDSEK